MNKDVRLVVVPAALVGLLLLGGCTQRAETGWATLDSATETVEATNTAAPIEQPLQSTPSTGAVVDPAVAAKPAARGSVKLFGLCTKPATPTLAQLKGWGVSSATVQYPGKGSVKVSGVKFMTVLTNVDVSEDAMYAMFKSANGSEVLVPLSDTVASPDSMLEIDASGKVNCVFPGAESDTYWAKDIVSIEFKQAP